MPQEQNNRFYSDEAQDILGKLPSWIIRREIPFIKATLGKWFNTEQIDSEINIVDKAYAVLDSHKTYCDKIHLSGTPLIAINSHVFPSNIYDIKDLRYIL